MAALQVLLLLLAVPPTAFTTIDVYYVTAHDAAGHEQSCPPHQICHNLSYYISQPDYYFTSDNTIIFLEGEHSFDREDLVNVSNVHDLTLKGQGQWPVAGAEETVMQSTVIINCTRGRGGFYFGTSHNITVEGLTVVNCGGMNNGAVFNFATIQSIFFHKNSIQHMTGYGLFLHNCDNVIVTNCSYYHSTVCDFSNNSSLFYGGLGIVYDTQYSNTGYSTLELSHSNMTKCCSLGRGGGVYLRVQKLGFHGKLLFNHLKFSQNEAVYGGGIGARLKGSSNVTFIVSNCDFFNGTALNGGGGMYIEVNIMQSANILLNNLKLSHNKADWGAGIDAYLNDSGNVTLTVSRCDFFNGTALNGGGGMYIEVKMMQSTNIQLNHLTFSHNKADLGGGIDAYLNGSGNVTLNVSRCDFVNGTALNGGGGMFIEVKMMQSTNILLNNLKLSHNKADWGAGIDAYLNDSGNVTLTVSSCDFFNGTALNGGGGRYIEVKMIQSTNIQLNDLTFSHNKADLGGGIDAYLNGSGNVTLNVSRCDFVNGTALNGGGGMYIEVNMMQSTNILLNNLKLSHNKAELGGGIDAYLNGSGNVTLNVSNCDFFNGTALNGSGGGMYIEVNMMQSTNIYSTI